MSLRTRILAPITLIMVAAFAVMFVATASIFESLRMHSASVSATVIAEIVEGGLTRAMLTGRQKDIQKTLDSITRLNSVPEISVLRADASVFVSSGYRARELNELLDAASRDSKVPQKVRQLSIGDRRYLRVITTIENQKPCHNCHGAARQNLGHVQVTLPGDWLQHRVLAAEHLVLIVAAVTLALIWVALTHTLNSSVLSRVTGFIELIGRVRSGARNLRVDTQHQDELGRVAVAFNDMLDEIASTETILIEREKQLAQSQKLAGIGLMAGGIAHQINNPLTAVSTAAEAIATTDLSQEQVTRMAGLIVESSGRIKDIVGDLLSLDRQRGLKLEEADIADILYESVAAVDVPEEVQVISDIRRDIPKLRIDKRMLGRAFVNILDNAVRAMPDGGEVRIDAEAVAGNVNISISDTGCGITEDAAPHVFDPFFTTRDVDEGYGLGLAVAYGAVSRHGGTIKLISQPGQGAAFQIQLPVSGAQELPDA